MDNTWEKETRGGGGVDSGGGGVSKRKRRGLVIIWVYIILGKEVGVWRGGGVERFKLEGVGPQQEEARVLLLLDVFIFIFFYSCKDFLLYNVIVMETDKVLPRNKETRKVSIYSISIYRGCM